MPFFEIIGETTNRQVIARGGDINDLVKLKQSYGGRKGGSRMAEGTVKRFSGEKGYGFIAPDEGGEDVYFHYTAIEGVGYRSLGEGERVSFEPGDSRRGEIASDVRKFG